MPRKKKEENTLITSQIPEEIVFNNIKSTITKARNNIAKVINSEMVKTYWEIGAYIYNAQNGQERANYGSYLIKYLADKLTREFGKGFSARTLKYARQFYITFAIEFKVCAQSFLDNQDSRGSKKGNSIKVCAQSSTENQPPKCPKELLKLSWSHLRTIMRLYDMEEMNFYIKECIDGNWSVRQLERQIESSYYRRLLATQQKDIKRLKKEVNEEDKNIEYKTNPLYHIKDPYVLEFLNLKEKKNTLEKEIESKIIDNLRDFILELGKGFTFVTRQKRISSDSEHFYVDLVFYNIILKCYVLIDLKRGKITHKDMGQMDFYIGYFDKEIKQPTDNPTIGIVLCTEKDNAIAKYSTLNDNKRLFISKYMDYFPSELELEKYLISQRELLEMEEEIDKDNNNNE